MRHRTAHDIAAADLGNPVPGLPLTYIPQAGQLNHCRKTVGRALNGAVNLR
jgi:hypothetical protein